MSVDTQQPINCALRDLHRAVAAQKLAIIVLRLRERAEAYRKQECNTEAHHGRVMYAAAVLDQMADEIEGMA